MYRFLPLFLLLGACTPIDLVDDIDEDVDCDPCADTDADSDADSDTDADTDPTDEWAGYVSASGFTVSFDDGGFSDDVYLAPAYMVGYGGDLGYNLDADFRSTNSGGRFAFDTSSWSRDCYDSSLISSLEALDDGSYANATSWADTADWWDNHQFCTSGSPTAQAWCYHEGGENYFVSFCVTSSGVVPNGDGY